MQHRADTSWAPMACYAGFPPVERFNLPLYGGSLYLQQQNSVSSLDRWECNLFLNAHQSISSYTCLGTVSRNSAYPGYCSMFPYIVICMGLYCSHSCQHTGFSNLTQKVQYNRCGLLKMSNSLNKLSSARLLIQVLICILKSWFPQVNQN